MSATIARVLMGQKVNSCAYALNAKRLFVLAITGRSSALGVAARNGKLFGEVAKFLVVKLTAGV